jgi:hypothetical protein
MTPDGLVLDVLVGLSGGAIGLDRLGRVVIAFLGSAFPGRKR